MNQNKIKKYLLVLICVMIISACGYVGFSLFLNDYQPLIDSRNIIVITPTFTQSAYQKNGFYSYYSKECDIRCLTVLINKTDPSSMSSSRNGFNELKQRGFKFITDLQVDQNPNILKNYTTVILLHNEYVTQKEFDAITSFPNVIYLYPNSLYAKIENNNNGTITLIRGHGYPSSNILNGFDWKYDSTKFEKDRDCKDMKFYKVPNGFQINCYPEYDMVNKIIWKQISP